MFGAGGLSFVEIPIWGDRAGCCVVALPESNVEVCFGPCHADQGLYRARVLGSMCLCEEVRSALEQP